ncbi:MAG: HAMP domain-containing sensor histidine kinase [Gemmataceae bacterium]
MVRSIRARLLVWYAVVLLIVVGGLAAAVYVQTRQARLSRIDDRLKAAANYLDATLRGMPGHVIDGTLPPPPSRGPPPKDGKGPPGKGGKRGPPPRDGSGTNVGTDSGLRPLGMPPPDLEPRGASGPEDDEPVDVVIWRSDGSIIKASDATEAPPRPDIPNYALPNPGEPYCISLGGRREAFAVGPRNALIRVGRSIEREMADLRRLAWQLAAGSAIALAVGLAGGWVIASRILRPVAAIADTAAAISATNLSQRIDTTALDVELVGLANVLNGAFARLEESFARQVRFTADASHELRTPLAVLSAHAESALARQRTDEEYRDALEQVRRSAKRMRSLVDGLLTLARADAGKLDFSKRIIDLRSIVEEAVDQYLPVAQRAGIDLSANLPDEPVRVSGDAAFLGRVAENLLDNALRHTPSAGKVTVTLAVERDGIVLRVVDTGSGIPAADQPRVFERFYRADAARSRASGGVGLGLAICKSVVEAHGGKIGFTSQPGRGATFTVALPRA